MLRKSIIFLALALVGVGLLLPIASRTEFFRRLAEVSLHRATGLEIGFSAISVAQAEALRRQQEAEIRQLISSIEPAPNSAQELAQRLLRENLISGVISGDRSAES